MKATTEAVRSRKRRVHSVTLGHVSPQGAGADGSRRWSTWREERPLRGELGADQVRGTWKPWRSLSPASSKEKEVTKPIGSCWTGVIGGSSQSGFGHMGEQKPDGLESRREGRVGMWRLSSFVNWLKMGEERVQAVVQMEHRSGEGLLSYMGTL